MHIVRTPILLLPPCIFYLIRRKMHSVRCEYIISLVQSSLSTLCKFSLASFSSNVCEGDVGPKLGHGPEAEISLIGATSGGKG